MIVKPWNTLNNSKIKVKDVKRLEEKYIKKFKIQNLDNASLDQGTRLFLSVINDYKSGNLSLDELSSFGFELFHKIGKKYPNSKLFQASLSASELAFATRSESAYKNIILYLNDIDKFFKSDGN